MNKVGLVTKLRMLKKDLNLKLPNVQFQELTLPEHKDQLNDFEILIADFDLLGPYIAQLKRTKWIHGTWAGIDFLPQYVDRNAPPSFVLTRTYFGRPMFEYVVAHIINLERNFFDCYKSRVEGVWNDGEMDRYRTLTDLTVGVLGVGAIGTFVARGLNNLGAKIVGYKRTETLTPELNFLSGLYSTSRLPQMLQKCDYVVNILPRTPETDDLLSGSMLKNCKRGAVFVNIGRSNVIKELDLIRALNEKWIRAAVLDVFDVEPLPKENPLWKMPQVYITPHVAGPTRTQDVAENFAENYKLFTEGQPMPLTVQYSLGY